MAGKKRKHGGGSASAHAKAQKKKTKQAAAAAALRDAEEAQQHREGAVTNEDAVMENGASDDTEVAVDVDNETDILSAELREELGGKDGDLMVIVGKKKKKAKEDVVPDEIMEQAAKMSKSKRKKLEHIAVRLYAICYASQMGTLFVCMSHSRVFVCGLHHFTGS